MVSLSAIELALSSAAASPPTPSRSMAAVAMVLAGEPQALELCFILRATREGDRWSGQMAFPGGRAEHDDPTARAVAVRETHEELGLPLHGAKVLGSLPPISLRPMGGAIGVLAPFAFYAGRQRPPLHPSEAEVADAYWIPLAHLWDPSNSQTVDWDFRGQPLRFSGIRFREQVIWGLTYRVLTEWAALLGRPLPHGSAKPTMVDPSTSTPADQSRPRG
ncbi:MAG: CoA pyrophosphatase [Deltaproteobacteria bacterium]|nr:CoA pyrophosphatase [Deltaproteobacteria bacterium]